MLLTEVQRHRTGLLQFLIILIMISLGLIMVISYQPIGSVSIPSIALVSLGACLYAAVRERKLRRIQDRLIDEYAASKLRENHLDQTLSDERDRTHDLDHRLKETAQLYRAISRVNAVLDHRRTLPTVVEAALDLVAGDCGSLMLLDETRQHLYVACSKGLDERVAAGAKRPIGEGVAGWVAQHGEPLLLEGQASDDPRFTNTGDRIDGLEFSMVVPLTHRGAVVGVLNLGIRSTESRPKEQVEIELRMVTLYAQHASVAVRNVRLESRLAKRAG